MFDDAATALMALIILNFVGTIIMFLFLLRSQDQSRRFLVEQCAQVQLLLMDLEQRMLSRLPLSEDNTPADPLFSPDNDLETLLGTHAARMTSPVVSAPAVSAPDIPAPGVPGPCSFRTPASSVLKRG
jgi:hypothetical protein